MGKKIRSCAYGIAPLGQGHANEMFSEPVVCEIAAKYAKTPAQILLRRTIQDGVAVIPKSVHTKRIAENISIFDFELLLNMRSLLGQNRCLLQKISTGPPVDIHIFNPARSKHSHRAF